ncbi:MAG TPA: TonB-dependent receptor [Chitinophagaceae bacterium]|nr:TonB-dependent receptor [Chitinophagaceae bacterium]
MRLLVVLILLALFPSFVQAQETEDKKYSVSGTVVNEKGTSVPYSSVSLLRRSDSSQVFITASDEKGEFDFSILPGAWLLKVSFLSYNEELVPFTITGSDIAFGKIVLRTNAKTLNEVVVTSEKKLMELKLDKRVYNVSQDVSNIGSNASEILANIPSVDVDIDGNVSLRGSQGVRILIDGKPSALTGIRSNDALRNLQGALIDRIEVVTNPSSRYDAAGETGIINIILKKNKTRGFNGNFTGTIGYPSNLSAAYSINYRTQKVNLFSSFGTNFRKNPGSGSSIQKYTGADTSFIYHQTLDRSRKGISGNLVTGIDYTISPRTTLTGSFLVDLGREKNITNLLYEDFNDAGQLTSAVLRTDDETERESDKEVSLSFRKKYSENSDRELTADFKWTSSGETESSDYLQGDLDGGEKTIQRSGNPAYEDNLLLQTDYVHPFGENGKFETGFKGTIRKIANEYLVEEFANGDWVVLPAFDNNMEFTEKILAVYAMMGNKIKKLSYQFGLRGELTDMQTGLVKTNEINKRNYFNVFPSSSISYELDDKNTLQLSYSYRINRPHFRNLTPFANFSDPRVYFVGNPDLNPEFTHSMEAGHLLDWGRGSLFTSIYYRHKKGVSERIRILDSITGITNIIPINLSTQNDIGLESAFSIEVSNWWKFNTSFNFYHSEATGEYKGETYGSKTFSWTNRTTSRITIFKKVDFQTSLFYHSPRNNTQGKTLGMYTIDLGLSTDVFKGKGTLTLNIRDLMNSRRRRSIVDIPGYYSESEFQWRPRQIRLTLNFRLNQQKIQKEEAPGMDEGGFEN